MNLPAFLLFLFSVIHCYGAQEQQRQLQIPEASALTEPEDDLRAQIKELQKNVTDIWNYIYQLRTAVSQHLTHLRAHQADLEVFKHTMEHLHESDLHSMGHHHSGEQHSHSGEQHSHSGEQHSHSGEQHSHSGEHSHGSDQSHSGEQHSHGDDHGHYSHSYSHSHTSHDHSNGDSHSHSHADSHSHSHGDDHHDDQHHGHDHKDSHESEDVQQTSQVAEPAPAVVEPIVTATNRQDHSHHHHSQSTTRSGSADAMNLLNEHSFHHHHHHDGHRSSSSRNRTVELPRYSDYGQFDLATCSVSPNRYAVPEDIQQNIGGTVTLWQKKTGGPLNIHVQLQGFDVGDHHAHHQQLQTEDNETPVGHRHGFHIHAFGDLSNGCQSAGPHYNPKGANHGGPDSPDRHIGDLGNIECDERGYTNILFSDDVASLRGQYSVIGKAIVIHAKPDDLGLGGDAESLKTGNAGTRLACCVIQKVEKIPMRVYRAMKTATQYQNRS